MAFRNLGAVNTNMVTVGQLSIWFSYGTPVAFKTGQQETVCIQNEWGTTTGKLLNKLQPDHAKRLTAAEFTGKLDLAFRQAVQNLI